MFGKFVSIRRVCADSLLEMIQGQYVKQIRLVSCHGRQRDRHGNMQIQEYLNLLFFLRGSIRFVRQGPKWSGYHLATTSTNSIVP
jgi:hypothetical protein